MRVFRGCESVPPKKMALTRARSRRVRETSVVARSYATGARGGAREGRCSEKESFGATCRGIEASQTIGAGATENATLAVASAGMCSVWQTWHGVSGPLVCSCSSAPPHAKYSNAKQANSAKPRRSPSLSRVKDLCISEGTVGASTPFRSSLDGKRSCLVASVVCMHPNQQSVASQWAAG